VDHAVVAQAGHEKRERSRRGTTDQALVCMSGFPNKLSATPARVHRPAPALGEHTDQVLGDLGYDADRIAALRSDGVL